MNDHPAWNTGLRVKIDGIKNRKELPIMNEHLAKPQQQKEKRFEHSEG